MSSFFTRVKALVDDSDHSTNSDVFYPFEDALSNDTLLVFSGEVGQGSGGEGEEGEEGEEGGEGGKGRLLVGQHDAARSAMRVHGASVHVDDLVASSTLKVEGRLGVGRPCSGESVIDARGSMLRLTGTGDGPTEIRVFGDSDPLSRAKDTECVLKLICGSNEDASDKTTELGSSLVHPVFVRSAGVNRAVIDTHGRMGVGIDDPLDSLHVGGGIIGTNFRVFQRQPQPGRSVEAVAVEGSAAPVLRVVQDGANEDMFEFSEEEGGRRKQHTVEVVSPYGHPALVVEAEKGFVGINTHTPSEALHVAGCAKVDGRVNLMGETALWGERGGKREGEREGEGEEGSGGERGDQPALFVEGKGRGVSSVGIGTSNPTARLDVRGNVVAESFSGSGSNIHDIDADNVTLGTLPVERGGTGVTELAAHRLLVGGGGSNHDDGGRIGTTGVTCPDGLRWDPTIECLHVEGGGGLVATSLAGDGRDVTNLDVDNASMGTLVVERGGTGATILSQDCLVVGNGSNAAFCPEGLRWTWDRPESGSFSNITALPPPYLEVEGGVVAHRFEGDGREVRGLDMDNALFGVLSVDRGGTGKDSLERGKLLVGNGKDPVMSFTALHWDEENLRVGINTSEPTVDLEVAGQVKAAAFEGDLDMDDAVAGVLSTSRGGTGIPAPSADKLLVGGGGQGEPLKCPSDLHWDGDRRRLGIRTETPTRELDVFGSVGATTFFGDGAGITNLDANQVATGTLDVRRGGTGTAAPPSNKLMVGSGATDSVRGPAELHWDGSNLRLGIGTDTPSERLEVDGTARATHFAGEGSAVTNLNMDAASHGVLSTERGGTGLVELPEGSVLVGGGPSSSVCTPLGLTWTEWTEGGEGGEKKRRLNVVDGEVRATSFVGEGRDISNLDMDSAGLGVLPTERGGTGAGTHTEDKLLVGDGTGPFKSPSSLHWDAENERLGINTSVPQRTFDVEGSARFSTEVHSGSFHGDGRHITHLDVDSVNAGVLSVEHGGTGTSSLSSGKILVAAEREEGEGVSNVTVVDTPDGLRWDGESSTLHVFQGSMTVDNVVEAGRFAGDGSTVTSLDVANVTSGELAVRHGGTGREELAHDRLLVGKGSNAAVSCPEGLRWYDDTQWLDVSSEGGDRGDRGDVGKGGVSARFFAGDGRGITSLDVNNVTSGELDVKHGGTGRDDLAVDRLLVGGGSNAAVSCPEGLRWDSTTQWLDVSGGGVSNASIGFLEDVEEERRGGVSAWYFAGDGRAITSLDADNVTMGTLSVDRGGTGTHELPADRLLVGGGSNSGVSCPSGLRWDATTQWLDVSDGIIGEGGGSTEDGGERGGVSARYFAGDGRAITSLDMDNVASGTLAVRWGGTGTNAMTSDKLLVSQGSDENGGRTGVATPAALHWDAQNTRLGVNVDRPAARVDVGGNILASGKISGVADGRLRDNLELISGAVDRVKQIRGYTFDVPSNGDGLRHAGVMGQEVQSQTALPEAVSQNSDGYLSVAYEDLLALALEAIRELAVQVEDLQKQSSIA